MKGYLLDINSLLALAWPNHLHHRAAHEWFARESKRGWGTCSVTQLGLVRISSHPAFEYHVSTPEAFQKLEEIVGVPGHAFWPEPAGGFASESLSPAFSKILTQSMVTDGFLAGIATFNGGKLATFDKTLARAFPDSCVLVGAVR